MAMQRFDCLSRTCPVFGPHLLEASAGTGKTFSIEHVYLRLILESRKNDPIEVENILVVTFTRAATRELKSRIRANFEKALYFLRSKNIEDAWDYLRPYINSGIESEDSDEAVRALSDALASFDRCQIFTIHGFCWRMLREYAFEAKEGFTLPDPDGERVVPERFRQAALDFLEYGIDGDLLCPEQAAILLKKYESLDEIADRLLHLEKTQGFSFSEFHEKCKAALQSWSGDRVEEAKLIDDFRSLENGFKKKDGNFETQAAALAQIFSEPSDPAPYREILKEKSSLFDFFDLSNRKIKAVMPESLHYPGIFDWARTHLSPLIQEAHKKIFPTLQAAWNPVAERILKEEAWVDPDKILEKMQNAVGNESFATAVQKKYKAAIIDEFQDTDAIQWDIFRRLFLEKDLLRALYLVGDPKQSIYRFRKADVYIYLQARALLGDAHLYQLDTNFRSSKKLVAALNALFSRDWMHLPQLKRTLPFLPVQAGSNIDSTFSDEKGSIHFLLADAKEAKDPFEAIFLPFAAEEIERLLPEVKNGSAFALLVKDRYQAETALLFLRQRGIAAIARSRTPLGQTLAFQAIRELFDAILSPGESAAKIVEMGPFGASFPFSDFKILLETKGLVSFCSEFLTTPVQQASLKERIVSYDLSFYRDMMQIFEALFSWEAKEGFSFKGLDRFLNRLEKLNEDEGGRRRMESDEGAVQIMTLHVSKGLEFEIVFALGLASRTPETEEGVEEANAEKLRQLYVAMTRAKRRLYVPAVLSQKEADASSHSPMELFCRTLETESPLADFLADLSKKESLTFEWAGAEKNSISEEKTETKRAVSLSFEEFRPSIAPSYLYSFSSLAQTKSEIGGEKAPVSLVGLAEKKEKAEGFTLHTLPKGTETGIAIHQLFEKVFTSSIWKNEAALHQLVEDEFRFSPLRPWKEALLQMVQNTLALPLESDGASFSLGQLEPNELCVEMEFLFATPPNYIKGFIDLVFCHKGKYYFLDWKTNWLGDSDAAYDPLSLKNAMESHDYPLQAALYAEALRRYLNKGEIFGGAFYMFLRGGAITHLKELWKM